MPGTSVPHSKSRRPHMLMHTPTSMHSHTDQYLLHAYAQSTMRETSTFPPRWSLPTSTATTRA